MLPSVDATLLVFPRGADVAAMVQIDFNDQPVAIHHSNVTFSTGMTLAVIEARPSLRQSSAHPQ